MLNSKIILIVCILILSGGGRATAQAFDHSSVSAPGVFDHSTVENAWKTAIERQHPLLVMFTSDNCTFCRKMVTTTYSDPHVRRLLRGRTESVMAHANDYDALIKKLGIRGYPSSLLISPDGQVLDFIEGYVEAKTFAQRIAPLLTEPVQRVGQVDSLGRTN